MSALFLFHRDLRLQDNTTLYQAIEAKQPILPVFIFTPEQIDPKRNAHFSHHAVQYMCESLADLDQSLRKLGSQLFVFYGDTVKVLAKIHTQAPFQALYSNKDVSAYAIQRDLKIEKWCQTVSIPFIHQEDYGLLPLHTGLLEDGRPYKVLSQYYNHFLKLDAVPPVQKKTLKSAYFVPSTTSLKTLDWRTIHEFYLHNPHQAFHGGRPDARRVLNHLKDLAKYSTERDTPSLEGTSKASAALKFGTLSIREFYWAIRGLYGPDNALIRQLVFRDMYQKIFALQPELQRGTAYYQTIDKHVPWRYSKAEFERWTKGQTGFPLVDAGMRELNATGWMHNRVRLVVASFLSQYLLIDWRLGAKYFSQQLIDGDIFNNTAGWMTQAAVFPSGAPYYRAPINPYIQSTKHDPDAIYIKQWVPELAPVAPKDIHRWHNPQVREKYDYIYLAPMIEQKEASQRAIKVFRRAYKYR